MIKALSNPCTRCGKERIQLKKWVEEIPSYNNKIIKITRATNVCPDPECQKIIEGELAVQKSKRDKIKKDHEDKVLLKQKKKEVGD